MIGLTLSVARRVFRIMLITTLAGIVLTFSRALVSTTIGSAKAPDTPAVTAFADTLKSQLTGYREGIQNAIASIGLASPADDHARVVHVSDGDTFDVRVDGEVTRVRIIGVDTPETVKPGTDVQCYGPAASSFTKSHLSGRVVVLSYDRERRDKYGRTLAYVELGGKDYGATLLRGGYARTLTIPPNDSRAERYARISAHAKKKQRGLWGACS